jgi:hypothetical protein
MAIEYTQTRYNQIVAAKIANENAISDLYANFDNFTQDDKFIALEIIDNLNIINEEFTKYIAVYNTIEQQLEQDLEYVVSMGDTILSIAQKMTGDYNNWKEIMRFNNISDIDLEVGTILLIPRIS